MTYYRNDEEGYLSHLSTGAGREEITQDEYLRLREIFQTRPGDAPEGYYYRLTSDTEEWELCEKPAPEEDPELTDGQIIRTLFGGES